MDILASTIYMYVWFVIVILLHECGHFIASKFMGFSVSSICIGFGPTIFRLSRNNIEYCLKLIPLAGYCKVDELNISHAPRENNIRLLHIKKIIVYLSGPAMNLFLAIMILMTLSNPGGIIVTYVNNEYFNEQNIDNGYALKYVNNNKIVRLSDFSGLMQLNNKNEFVFFTPNGEYATVTIYVSNDNIGGLYFRRQKIIPRVMSVFMEFRSIVSQVLRVSQDYEPSRNSIDTPLSVVRNTSLPSIYRIYFFVYQLGIISFIIFFVNMLPVFVFDGYKIVYSFIPVLTGKIIHGKFEKTLNLLGFLLLFLYVFILYIR